jgi:hypothetical protein
MSLELAKNDWTQHLTKEFCDHVGLHAKENDDMEKRCQDGKKGLFWRRVGKPPVQAA